MAVSSKARDARLRREYGFTPGQYQTLLRKQQGRCAICNRPPKRVRLSVDHDHTTGFVRGLLCMRCNRAIATFGDSPALMNRASQYLLHTDDLWETLSEAEQEAWLTYRGRINGKGRRKRITKNGQPNLRLPQTETP